jgi:heptosyltransferase-1
VKSAIITKFSRGKSFGPHYQSARESLAGFMYRHPLKIAKVTQQHAIDRMRHLFSQALGYQILSPTIDYGIDKTRLPTLTYGEHCILFLHGTTWLACLAGDSGYKVLLPWGNENERNRACAIQDFMQAKGLMTYVQVLPKLSLGEMTALIANVKGIVAVDTGLGHVAAAMSTPTVSLYGPTDPLLTGAQGKLQTHLVADYSCAPCLSRTCQKPGRFAIMPPCFESLPPEKVWQALCQNMMCDVLSSRPTLDVKKDLC